MAHFSNIEEISVPRLKMIHLAIRTLSKLISHLFLELQFLKPSLWFLLCLSSYLM